MNGQVQPFELESQFTGISGNITNVVDTATGVMTGVNGELFHNFTSSSVDFAESSNILGLEIVGGTSQSEIENEGSPLADDRVWLVTCKSDKILGPTKLTRYLESIPTNSLQNLHGLVFASPCTFSKEAIDVFHDWCSKKGIVEFYLWGRDEIEKLLYHSKNDQLLFTYFNLSVSIRRQKLSSLIHQQVALKRRLKQLFPGDLLPLVLRDVADDRYPDTKGCTSAAPSSSNLTGAERPHWAIEPSQGRIHF